ncbi:hypothetical protein ARMSODRAFT_977437 [Armillaria solidipes]|uniref:Uncharacterized protein n=1 Tax=Armillaria solidipes TaxID=1076256 RepID=A0A2H3B6H8_9AGAR|nr:hypothetical protein ARMSODRAFT_977437 [Armillaria solidipes]
MSSVRITLRTTANCIEHFKWYADVMKTHYLDANWESCTNTARTCTYWCLHGTGRSVVKQTYGMTLDRNLTQYPSSSLWTEKMRAGTSTFKGFTTTDSDAWKSRLDSLLLASLRTEEVFILGGCLLSPFTSTSRLWRTILVSTIFDTDNGDEHEKRDFDSDGGDKEVEKLQSSFKAVLANI